MRDPTPDQLVVELLRTLNEAIHDRAYWAGGGGVNLMPTTYSEHSYPELEARLMDMRDDPHHRPEWWHVNARYLWGYERWLRVPFRRTVKGPVPVLPGRAEERILGEIVRIETANGGHVSVMQVKCYVWGSDVDPKMVDRGIHHLTTIMYDGDTTKLSLPTPFLWRMLGIERGEASVRQPGASHVQGHALAAP